MLRRVFSLLLVLSLPFACAETSSGDEGCTGDSDNEYCKPVLETAPTDGKADSASGASGLPTSVDNSSTVVWEVSNQWEDKNTAAAAEAGIAWGADSGLDWNEKYSLWIKQMERVGGHDTYYDTFLLTTPWGKTLQAPNLECAETGLFLRATFASWYSLPFYIEAYDPTEGGIYFGHFGIRSKNGRWGGLPNFKTSYSDHTASYAGGDWPSDSKLRSRKLSKNGDDENTFLGEELYAGAYFDEIFLNKRTGHFMYYLLVYTGSMHLASSGNTFNLKPEALREGDVLLERWQRRGIGHTLVVKKVDMIDGERMDASLVSGSMPRRQPKWENGASSKSYFTNRYCGGEGENSDGDKYAALGGGLKRFRIAKPSNGIYRNQIPTTDRENWINDTDLEAIAGRIATFETLLGELSPAEKRDMLVAKIEDKRSHLSNYPSSCSARIGREEAFTELYEVMKEHFSWDRARVDAEYRKLEDYVFAELVYELSKTCCWNSSTSAMYEIAMQYNLKKAFDVETQTCTDVTVFMGRDDSGDGFQLFADYAASIGRGDEWVTWSADESCPQQDKPADTEEVHGWTAQCDLIHALVEGAIAPPDPCIDEFAGNDDADHATAVTPGTYEGLGICVEEQDWFVLESGADELTVTLSFMNADGDIDMEVKDAAGAQIGFSNSTEDEESVTVPADSGTVYVIVKGYSRATNSYSMTIE